MFASATRKRGAQAVVRASRSASRRGRFSGGAAAAAAAAASIAASAVVKVSRPLESVSCQSQDEPKKGKRRADRKMGETLVLGLTGSIGMGKSTVSQWLQDMGVPVEDADASVHRLYAPGGAAVEPVRALFGDSVMTPEGGISRPELTKHVVGAANSENLRKLEKVVFPLVDQARVEFVETAIKRGEPLVVLDIPLLLERKGEAICDKVLVVSAPADVQRERVLAREGWTKEKFEAILEKQVPDAIKRQKADVVIDTAQTFDQTRAAVKDFVDICRKQVENERARLVQQQKQRFHELPSPWVLATSTALPLALLAVLGRCCLAARPQAT